MNLTPKAGGGSAATVHLTKETLRLAIQFKRAEEATVLWPISRPAGEIEERGTLTILGREIPRRALVLEGKDKSVFLGDQFDDLELYVQLDDGLGAQIDYDVIEIPESVQSATDAILGSLTRTGELSPSRADILTYENTLYGFPFQYPATWTVEEVEGETVDTGAQMSKLADSVILRQGEFAIVVQYLRKSDPDHVAWGGRHQPVDLFFGDDVLGDKVTATGVETHKRIWTYNDGIKAVFVEAVADVADLVLHITLSHNTGASIRDSEAATISESAMAALDQILRSLAATQ